LTGEVLLQVDNVTKSFGGVLAVKGLSFTIDKGEILGLIGPNGAGKTTAFNLIAGLYKPDSGTITFDGEKVSGRKPHQVTKAGISRTFQIVKPFSRMSVIENVAVGALFGREQTLSVSHARRQAVEILTYVGLGEKREVPAAALSLAEQRRLELGRALAAKPKLLMLDEVMAGLNHSEISATLDLLRKLHSDKGLTLLVIEHVMRAMMQISDKIVVLNHGEKLAEGIPSDVVSNKEVVAAFMGEKKGRIQTSASITASSDNVSNP
jgi:branched-chain amino acid transport system ATP-binding protein